MPDTRRPLDSIGLAQRAGAQALGTDGVLKSAGTLRWQPAEPNLVGKRYSSDPRHYSLSTRLSLPTTFDESSSDGDSSSGVSVHEGFENLRRPRAPRLRVSNVATPSATGTATPKRNEQIERVEISRHSPQTFSQISTLSDVQSQRSAAVHPPATRLSPPASEPSPPTSIDSLPSPPPARQQKPRAQFLRPPPAPSPDAPHRVRKYPSSSRADSFRTAKEDIPTGTENSAVGTPIQLPASDRLQQHWLDSPTALAAASNNLEEVSVTPTPDIVVLKRSGRSTPVLLNGASLPTASEPASPTVDLEKHVSYVSGPEGLDDHVEPVSDKIKDSLDQSPKGLGLSADDESGRTKLSAEDVNNMVYQQLQVQNMKRYNGPSAHPGAISASVVVSAVDSTPKQLKRTTKCVSLRSGSNPFPTIDTKQSGSPNRGLAVTKTSKLDASPSMIESSVRHVSSPSNLGANTLNMAAITLSSMQETPPRRNNARTQPVHAEVQPTKRRNADADSPVLPQHFEHTLRHLSPGDRLSNNMSVRRTSLDASPKADVADRHSIETNIPNSSRTVKIEKNISVKRKGPIEQQIAKDKGKTTSHSPATRTPGAFPSVAPATPEIAAEKPQNSHSLRRFSRDERLENALPSPPGSRDRATPFSNRGDESRPTHSGIFRRRSNDIIIGSPRSDGYHHVRSQSLSSEVKSPLLSSTSKAFDARFLYPNLTPLSIAQYSDTDISVQEANGIRIFSHNNHSIREVDLPQNSRPTSKGYELANFAPMANGSAVVTPPKQQQQQQPVFSAHIDPPTPKIGSSMPNGHVDSPLTNPRQAPQPPTIKFIPPTPDKDLVQSEGSDRVDDGIQNERPVPPSRQLSLLQKARKYSDNLLARTGSRRDSRRIVVREERPAHLSPMWRPEGFWDSDSDDDDDYAYEPTRARLPAGGDTSDLDGHAATQQSETLPRKMSRRLPGFRGAGGFLLGNSVGIDRHGTNSRRHYVSTGSRKLSKSASQELIRRKGLVVLQTDGTVDTRRVTKREARQDDCETPDRRLTSWVVLQTLRARVHALRLAREERAREKRRDELRERIGMRVYHQGHT